MVLLDIPKIFVEGGWLHKYGESNMVFRKLNEEFL